MSPHFFNAIAAFSRRGLLLFLACATLAVWAPSPTLAQRPGRSFGGSPEAQARIAAERAKQEAKANEEKAKAEKAKAGDDKNSDDKKDDDKKDESNKDDSDSITRPDAPPSVPDPEELKATPDASGRVQFAFNGQPWPDVLQWLANVSKLSLDWQELPKDYLNLTTQRSYTLPEARDLINRHLQARGYVMMKAGEVLTVAKLDAIDPSLVPRVREEDLYDLQPHDYVKITFQLPETMQPKAAVEDVKQALSKHAKVMPLAATKRLLAIDSVANLRMVSALLNEERLEAEGKEIPARFPLKHARAEKVISTLYVVLGMDPAAQPSQMELRVQQQKMQLLMQMSKKGKDIGRMLNSDGPKVYLAFNRNENSILANAPPEQLKIIERTIEMLDIPAPGSQYKCPDGGCESAERFAESYKLDSIEPEALISSLEEIGDLDPLTDLRGDKKAKILFARATKADHAKIEKIIGQLDGSKYQVKVFWLRRHPADAVAGTIASLIGGKQEKKKESRRRPWYYGYSDNDDEEEEVVDLRVDADVENNRLIVRGNETQLAEVRDLLVEIGELPGKERNDSQPMRVIEAMDAATTDELLQQLRKSWPALGGGAELIINDNRAPQEQQPEAKAEETTQEQPIPAEDRTTGVQRSSLFRFSVLPTANVTPAAEQAPQSTPAKPTPAAAAQEDAPQPNADSPQEPVAITITKDGRLVITGDDPALRMRLEQMVDTLTPSEATFKEFVIQHVSALYLTMKLETYYEDILNADKEDKFDLWGEYQRTSRKEVVSRMSRRRPMKMVYNSVTNSIIVSNATKGQLEEIGRLIAVWDKPPRKDVVRQRRTGMVKLKYSQAKVVATALKEVYRDLLSTRDKEFDTEEEKGGGFATSQLTQIEYSGRELTDVGEKTPTQSTDAIETKFQGAMSVGVDELANMLVISANAELYESIVDMVHQLDEEARPQTTVQVHRLSGVPSEQLQKALGSAIGRPWPGGKPEQANGQNGQNQNDQRQNDRRRRDRRNRNRGR